MTLYRASESQRNVTTTPGGVHDWPNSWVFSRRSVTEQFTDVWYVL